MLIIATQDDSDSAADDDENNYNVDDDGTGWDIALTRALYMNHKISLCLSSDPLIDAFPVQLPQYRPRPDLSCTSFHRPLKSSHDLLVFP